MSLDTAEKIMKSRNQNELELAHFGESLNRDSRNRAKTIAIKQIKDAQPWDPVGYKAMAYIQLSVIQMGLGESMGEVGMNAIRGWIEALQGDEYDIANINVLAWSTLAYWTDKASKNDKFQLNFVCAKFGEEIGALIEQADGDKKGLLISTYRFQSVLSTVWNRQGGGRSLGPEAVSRIKEITEILDRSTRNRLSIQRWVLSRIG